MRVMGYTYGAFTKYVNSFKVLHFHNWYMNETKTKMITHLQFASVKFHTHIFCNEGKCCICIHKTDSSKVLLFEHTHSSNMDNKS
jgi:hypothetical protein